MRPPTGAWTPRSSMRGLALGFSCLDLNGELIVMIFVINNDQFALIAVTIKPNEVW